MNSSKSDLTNHAVTLPPRGHQIHSDKMCDPRFLSTSVLCIVQKCVLFPHCNCCNDGYNNLYFSRLDHSAPTRRQGGQTERRGETEAKDASAMEAIGSRTTMATSGSTAATDEAPVEVVVPPKGGAFFPGDFFVFCGHFFFLIWPSIFF